MKHTCHSMKNNIIKIISGAVFALIVHTGYTQSRPVAASPVSTDDSIMREQWNPKPALHVLAPAYNKESAVIIQDDRRWEYVDIKGGELVLYKTFHKIIRVNDDNGIESYNRIYLGVADNNDIVDIRARTILPNGKIIEIDKKNIKDLKEDDGNLYKIFAMEGLEKGCELEYYYTFKRSPVYFGLETLQGRFPVLDTRVQILAPQRLVFDLKGYNCTLTSTDTVLNGKRSFSSSQQNIPGAESEKYSTYRNNLQRLEFKLSYNMAVSKGEERLFTWNELAKRLYKLYSVFSEREVKAAGELVNNNKWDKSPTDRDKIIAVENWLKKNYASREDISSDDAENLEKIIKSRISNHRGITRLYLAIFERLGIDVQLVLTGDRSGTTIDRAFENWNKADNVILYFPGTKKFLAPTLLQTRYPWINPYWGATDGIFCKPTTIGNFTTAIAFIKNIPLEDYTQSFSNIESDITLNAGNDTVLVDMRQLYGGYTASVYRADFTFGSQDDQRKLTKDMVRFGTNSENIVSSGIENADFESYPDNKPFILHATVKANELLESAGNKLLVKIGDIIGPQAEMYQEKPRQFPMELGYPHALNRKINFTIPDGYTVKNLDDLNIKQVLTDEGDTTACFISSYTQEGKTVKILVKEEYRRVFYPLTQYADFKKIINASADFNKVVLVLEKKN
jgi:uncharacterized protein DUF3857